MVIESYSLRELPIPRWTMLLVLLLSGCSGDLPVKPDRDPGSSGSRKIETSLAKLFGPERTDYRHLVIENVSAQLGKPYRWGGKSPKTGFDCSGLVFFAHTQAGLKIPRKSVSQLTKAKKVALKQLQPGDLLFFRTKSSASHVGIFIGGQEFIHAPSRGKKVSKASLANHYWRRRLYAAGNFY